MRKPPHARFRCCLAWGLAAVLMMAPRAVSAAPCPPCGDVNCDGAVDVKDALLIAQRKVGMRDDLPCAAAAETNAAVGADLDDALAVARFAVGSHGPLACTPVVTGTTPALVPAEGGSSVEVHGAWFVPGASVSLGVATFASTYQDCGTVTFTTARRRPASLAVTVTNPDGRAGRGGSLAFEGAFRDVAAEAGITVVPERGTQLLPIAGGIVVGDYDGDDLLDLFVPNHGGTSALYHNRGDGTFSDEAAIAGVDAPGERANGGCFGDYDNDGDLDLYVTALGPDRLYRNDGHGIFTVVTDLAGVGDDNRGTGCSWGDFDHDGRLDLYVADHLDESDPTVFRTRNFAVAERPDHLFHNLGTGQFEDVTDVLGDAALVRGAGFGASFVDVDHDGDDDLYLVNDFGSEVQPNVLWRNDGPVTGSWLFTDVSAPTHAGVALWAMGLAIGDYDHDGRFDFYLTNIGRNLLLHARADGTYEDATDAAGVGREILNGKYQVGWGTAFFDYDNDGLEDLYVASGYLDSDPLVNSTQQSNGLYRNRGNGTFEDVSDVSGADTRGPSRGVAVADFDRDGSLDIAVVNLGEGVLLYRNNRHAARNWLEVKTVGTRSNRDGIGARVTLDAGSLRALREVVAGSSHMSQHALDVHFGLGTAQWVDRLEIAWPSGVTQVLQNLAVNRRIVVTEP